jgi:hypothetical protein
MRQEINNIILEEIKKMKLDKEMTEALAEILLFERENIDQKAPRFKEKICTIIERLAL